ncbi:MAG: plastocyanin/azurin family copper-binding protein [Candidatus Glassbacteria bacterium]
MFNALISLSRKIFLPVLGLSLSFVSIAGSLHADTVVVEMLGGPGQGDFRFSPDDVRIKAGDTIMWVNMSPSGIMHTATYGMGSKDPDSGLYFDSGFLSPGESFSHTFDNIGTYPYYCIPHEFFGMTGVIRVKAYHREASPRTF